jgi:DNA-binding NtrC family response regulator
VRELQNIIERAVVLCGGDTIGVADLPLDLRSGHAAADAATTQGGKSVEYREAKDSFERVYLLKVIEEAKGNISEAARLSGLSRRHFYEKLEKLGIKTEK